MCISTFNYIKRRVIINRSKIVTVIERINSYARHTFRNFNEPQTNTISERGISNARHTIRND